MNTTLSSGFHLANNNGYLLGHNFAAACRLNLQFFLWKQSLEFNLHPSIPIHPDLHIADIATGTAIWLIDLARELPSATLDGYDISLSQAPPPQWLSKNITLSHWDIFSPVPEHLLEKYDIIHLRLLILVVQNSDPVPIIRNVSRLLKPGGYIQWDDLNYPDTHVKRVEEDMQTPAFDKLRQFVYSKGRHDWVLDLPGILEKNGFTDARTEHFRDREELVMANGEQHLATMEEFVGGLERKGMVDDALQIKGMLGEVCMEAMRGVALSMPRVNVPEKRLRNALIKGLEVSWISGGADKMLSQIPEYNLAGNEQDRGLQKFLLLQNHTLQDA